MNLTGLHRRLSLALVFVAIACSPASDWELPL
jgi:hypothetical protein